MNDDQLLDSLRRAYREQKDGAPEDDLSPEEARDVASALETPLDAAAQERITARLLGAEPARDAPGSRWWWGVLPLVAAAAAVMFMISTPNSGVSVPVYRLEWEGAVSEQRGDDPKGPRKVVALGADATFSLTARPETAFKEPIQAQAALRAGAQPYRKWEVPIAISEQGSVRIEGKVEKLFGGRTGRFDISVVVTSGERLTDEALLAAAAGKGSDTVTVLASRVTIVDVD